MMGFRRLYLDRGRVKVLNKSNPLSGAYLLAQSSDKSVVSHNSSIREVPTTQTIEGRFDVPKTLRVECGEWLMSARDVRRKFHRRNYPPVPPYVTACIAWPVGSMGKQDHSR